MDKLAEKLEDEFKQHYIGWVHDDWDEGYNAGIFQCIECLKYMRKEGKMSESFTMPYALDEGAFAPTKAHQSDAGFDIRTPKRCYIASGKSAVIDTGVHVLIPDGYVGMLKSKSGLNVKFGLEGEGVIDAGYTGSIVVKMYNHSDKPYVFKSGDKLIQLVILPIPTVELARCTVEAFEKVESDRGANGFGSSGK